MKTTPQISVLLLCAALLPLGGCVISDFDVARERAEFHYSFDLSPKGRVSLDSFNGAIEVEGWDQNRVEISGTKYAATKELLERLRIETHNDADRVEVRAIRPSELRGNMGARLTVKMPKTAELDRVVTSNGSVTVTDVAAAPRVKTSNGGIDMNSVHGPLVLRSSNGHINVEHAEAAVEAETSNSSIKIHSAASAPIRASSSNGSITLDLGQAPKHDIRAHTSNSSITLHMPESSAARIKADTSNNSIQSDFDVAATSDGRKKSHLSGTIGTGGPTIELSTSNGGIRLTKGI